MITLNAVAVNTYLQDNEGKLITSNFYMTLKYDENYF